MEESKNPPAYPEIATEFAPSSREYTHVIHGMTLLDYFAGQALMGTLSALRQKVLCSEIANECYSVARAMLHERQKHL